ncbi:alpha/beta hydrolase [Streptacidiphilus sp. EB129]|uniref:alpha/beta hydrolase n=1 Tax=Streptacidiphilus sp. EB129 TaxID=3156262 RepID=UPI00351137D1
MGLTSQKLQILIALLAVLCFAATVWVWPRLGLRNWKALLGRVGLLLTSQVLTLAALGLAANNWGGFYSSWDDLLGTGGQNAPATINNGQAAKGPQTHTAADVSVLSSKPVPLMLPGAPTKASGGSVQKVDIKGSGTGLDEPAYVYLPPQYSDPAYAHRAFPVVLVFTGYPGTPENLISRMKYPTIAAQAIYQQKMQPTILVMMRPSVAMPRDNECVDAVGGPQAETFYTKDLHQAMAAHYRVGTTGAGWGVIGDSTGGYCALKLTMRHPEAFTAAASLSGYYSAAVDSTTGDLFGGSKQLQNENDLMWRLKNLPQPAVSLLVASSVKGESDYAATKAFAAAAKDPLKVATMYLPSGGHNFTTWNQETPIALPWLADKLSVPANGGTAPGTTPGTSTPGMPPLGTPTPGSSPSSPSPWALPASADEAIAPRPF